MFGKFKWFQGDEYDEYKDKAPWKINDEKVADLIHLTLYKSDSLWGGRLFEKYEELKKENRHTNYDEVDKRHKDSKDDIDEMKKTSKYSMLLSDLRITKLKKKDEELRKEEELRVTVKLYLGKIFLYIDYCENIGRDIDEQAWLELSGAHIFEDDEFKKNLLMADSEEVIKLYNAKKTEMDQITSTNEFVIWHLQCRISTLEWEVRKLKG